MKDKLKGWGGREFGVAKLVNRKSRKRRELKGVKLNVVIRNEYSKHIALNWHLIDGYIP